VLVQCADDNKVQFYSAHKCVGLNPPPATVIMLTF